MSTFSYTERFAALQEAERNRPTRRYLSNGEYKAQKAALTRAKNSGDGRKVLATVEKTVNAWNTAVWPDAWAMWRIALEDAAQTERMRAHRVLVGEEYEAALDLAEELTAASFVLFQH